MKTENFKKTTEQPDFERGHEILEQEVSHDARSGCSGTLLYFAYGSNMNLNQMAFRCPDAEVVDTVRLEGYRLAFCMDEQHLDQGDFDPILSAAGRSWRCTRHTHILWQKRKQPRCEAYLLPAAGECRELPHHPVLCHR